MVVTPTKNTPSKRASRAARARKQVSSSILIFRIVTGAGATIWPFSDIEGEFFWASFRDHLENRLRVYTHLLPLARTVDGMHDYDESIKTLAALFFVLFRARIAFVVITSAVAKRTDSVCRLDCLATRAARVSRCSVGCVTEVRSDRSTLR